MRKVVLPLLLAAAAAASATAWDVEGPEGLDLARWKGKVVLVDFWASWCAPCRASFPWMDGILRAHGAEGLVVVAVNLDEDRAAAERFLAERPLAAVHVSDPGGLLAARFGISTMPSALLFDRDGKLAYRHAGFREESEAVYERHVQDLLRGQLPSEAERAAAAADGDGSSVRPWERGRLADPDMELGADALDLSIDDHIYFSKEGASGGRGFGGGGCGCN